MPLPIKGRAPHATEVALAAALGDSVQGAFGPKLGKTGLLQQEETSHLLVFFEVVQGLVFIAPGCTKPLQRRTKNKLVAVVAVWRGRRVVAADELTGLCCC